MYCMNCGNKISEDAKFCDKCGTPVGLNGVNVAEGAVKKVIDFEKNGKALKIGIAVVAAVTLVGVGAGIGGAGKKDDVQIVQSTQNEEVSVVENQEDVIEEVVEEAVEESAVEEKSKDAIAAEAFAAFKQFNQIGDDAVCNMVWSYAVVNDVPVMVGSMTDIGDDASWNNVYLLTYINGNVQQYKLGSWGTAAGNGNIFYNPDENYFITQTYGMNGSNYTLLLEIAENGVPRYKYGVYSYYNMEDQQEFFVLSDEFSKSVPGFGAVCDLQYPEGEWLVPTDESSYLATMREIGNYMGNVYSITGKNAAEIDDVFNHVKMVNQMDTAYEMYQASDKNGFLIWE